MRGAPCAGGRQRGIAVALSRKGPPLRQRSGGGGGAELLERLAIGPGQPLAKPGRVNPFRGGLRRGPIFRGRAAMSSDKISSPWLRLVRDAQPGGCTFTSRPTTLVRRAQPLMLPTLLPMSTRFFVACFTRCRRPPFHRTSIMSPASTSSGFTGPSVTNCPSSMQPRMEPLLGRTVTCSPRSNARSASVAHPMLPCL